jgi:peptide/nickel transport system substrate-binding protein
MPAHRLVAIVFLAIVTSAAAQVLVTAVPLDPTSLDPHRATEGYSLSITNQIYDTLVRLGDDGAIEPGLARAWSRPAPDVLRLELQPGVRFHDGRPLDAEAVAASLRRLADPATGARGGFLVAPVLEMRVVDALTLELVTDGPSVPLLANLTFPATAIVPPGAGPELGRAPTGTGPFRFVAWRSGESVELAANTDYWGGSPPLAGVRFRVIPEPASQLVAFRAGDLHLLQDLPADAIAALTGAPGVEVVRYPSDRTTYLEFNLDHPVLADVRVRRAIAHAIDAPLLVETLFAGGALPPSGLLSPLVRDTLRVDDLYPYDPARSRALLAEAGAVGVRLRLDLTTESDLDVVAQYVQAALAAVGVTVELRRSEFPVLYELLTSGQGELSIGFWGSDTLIPDFMMGAALHGSQAGANNTSGYQVAEVDALLDAAAATLDPEARRALLLAAQRRVLDDLPMLPLYHHVGTYVKRSTLTGERVVASSFQLDLRGARLDGTGR